MTETIPSEINDEIKPTLSLRERARLHAIASIALEPRSHEVNKPMDTYANGRVRRFGDANLRSGYSGAMRTEIDLPDGRMVSVHKNIMPVVGLAAPRFDSITVSSGDTEIGTIDLAIDPDTSPYNPSYIATLRGQRLLDEATGDELDLALADDLLDYAVSREARDRGLSGYFGSAGFTGEVVTAMTPGYSVEGINQDLFDPSSAST